MKYTDNVRLKKPEGTDFYNVEDFNYNADLIDQQIVALLAAIAAMGNIETVMERLFSRVVSTAMTDETGAKLVTETGDKIDLYFTLAIE